VSTKEIRRYEDGANGPYHIDEIRETIYSCKHCQRIYTGFHGLHAARWCCCNDCPCESMSCDNRTTGRSMHCDPCRARRIDDQWMAFKKVSPQFPCVRFGDDTYFFTEEELIEWMDDQEDGEHTRVRCVVAERMIVPIFEVQEFLCDMGYEDHEFDDSNDDAINALIKQVAPETWTGSGKFFEYARERPGA